MAKSIRSKHKRRMRAIKRERYGKKELDRLKKTLGIVDNAVDTDVEIKEDNVITFVLPEEIKKNKAASKLKEAESHAGTAVGERLDEDIEMTCEIKKAKKVKGSFPTWMNQRHIRKINTARKAKKQSRKKSKK